MHLDNKIVVITGGSQGFGKALARFFIEEGSKVVISSNDKEGLKTTANELFADCFFADVTSKEDVTKLGEYVFRKYGVIDIWINNAGIQVAPGPMEKIDSHELHRLFSINFFGYFYGCQVALSYMKQQGHGLIINVNSTSGLEGKAEISAYSSSKFAIRGLTESIRKEIKDSNIKMYGVFPGGMQTEIYKDKHPADLNEYMEVEPVAKKVVENVKAARPKIDLIIRRPIS